jgi:hypothetical protein
MRKRLAESNDITIVYYTSNYLETKHPSFLEKTKNQLLRSADGLPIVIVSQKPTMFGENSVNVNMGDIGRSHLNIYRQILEGAKAAKTHYVAMAEDDILYSYEHFHTYVPEDETFLYDMNRLSILTWIRPPLYSYRHNRTVVNQLIAPRQMLIDCLTSRFDRVPELLKTMGEERMLRFWGDPGRYETNLGCLSRNIDTFMSTCSSIVFSHEYAYGYEYNQGKRKSLGDLRIIETPVCMRCGLGGRAEEVLQNIYLTRT